MAREVTLRQCAAVGKRLGNGSFWAMICDARVEEIGERLLGGVKLRGG